MLKKNEVRSLELRKIKFKPTLLYRILDKEQNDGMSLFFQCLCQLEIKIAL